MPLGLSCAGGNDDANDMLERHSDTPVSQLERLNERGAFLETADLANRLLRQHAAAGLIEGAASDAGEVAAITYHHVWAVARSGGTKRALQLYDDYRMGERLDGKSQGLHARLLKDLALKTDPPQRQDALKQAADAYAAVFERHGGPWPAVNAATLHLLSGDRDAAAAWSQKTFGACAEMTPGSETEGYFRAVSMAEAALVIGDVRTATLELWRAGTYDTVGHATRATTRKQLRFICEANQLEPDILDLIEVPQVIYYAGHIISPPGSGGRFPADKEAEVAREIGRYLDNGKIGFAFGSLAAGADILFAEACRERGIDLHVVLPFDTEEFIRASVAPAGTGWVDRFHACLAWCRQREPQGAGSITLATDGAFLGDESLFLYGSQFAMGLAVLRARNLDTEPGMIAVYDGGETEGVGTGGSIALWGELGLRSTIIPVRGGSGETVKIAWESASPDVPERHPHAILYGDLEGFSELREEEVARFNNTIMSKISAVLGAYKKNVLYKNSFGDAVYVVFDAALPAARCALEIQKVFDRAEFKETAKGSRLSFRLGGHFGPVFHGTDFIRNEPAYYGTQVTKVARIEPVTPPGAVYVTESMAAALALSDSYDIECDYVGIVALAKDYGEFRMYVLRER